MLVQFELGAVVVVAWYGLLVAWYGNSYDDNGVFGVGCCCTR